MCNINASNQNRILDFLKSEDFKKTYDTYLTLKNDSDISFNIFSMISDYYHKENMHTDILKKFLDPNAGHEEGNKFLYLFIDMINELAQQEQQKIASYFCNLDKQLSLQAQRLEKLKQIKAACLDKMFV